jgi:hypothetical protein
MPINDNVLDEIVMSHHDNTERTFLSRKDKRMSGQKRRAEATVRSKVDRILKSQFQLEHRYTEKVKGLEKEIEQLKTKLWGS